MALYPKIHSIFHLSIASGYGCYLLTGGQNFQRLLFCFSFV